MDTLIYEFMQLLKVISNYGDPSLRHNNHKINWKKEERRMVLVLWVILRNHIWHQQVVKTTFISIKTRLQGRSDIDTIIWAVRCSKEEAPKIA
jgi:hypothetical protein